ncbi:ABC transporter substrate-binding protein [Planktothrix paucivesiculata]|uniref:ABC-type nitrate/sulfonate/bicarbonate transport systems periplasmic components-like n=1 Tax=Planktothrix paucivesiculata PCC 9631 TaxID=671071 RepID=A0A7Z9E5E8_9CYAN|nr:ABC transporter substrate-binding protein [Planktothrix paucivesiculata]VXD24819.1 ABC-type nitrate/sulfonate/bicarbonate transport systems periplasmic components-like [Planktothrix paucivesiculata PCC 9631]
MLKLLRYISISLITVCLLFACHASVPIKVKHPPLKVVFTSFVGEHSGIIAQEKGFFKAQGVDVELIYKQYIQLEMANFSAGKYDGMVLTLGSFINLSATNPDIQGVVVINESTGADVVVAQSQIKTVADLKGKKLGANLGGFSEIFVTEMLKTANLTSDDVNLVKVEASEIPQHLKNNAIQAGHTWEPHLSEAIKLGGNILFTSKQTPGLILDMIIFRSEIIRDRPEDVRAFVRGWLEGSAYWKANVQEGNAIISKALKIPLNTIYLEGVNLTDLSENQKLFQSSNPNSIYKTAKIYADFFIRSGNVTRIPKLKSLFNSSFLNPP